MSTIDMDTIERKTDEEIRSIIRDTVERVRKYADAEEAAGRSFDVSSFLLVAVLARLMDFRTLRNTFPKATYYRYLQRFKHAGIPF